MAPTYSRMCDRHRTAADNNWSVSPNVNPYTGQTGTHAPTYDDKAPSTGFGSSGSNSSFGAPNPYGHRSK